MEQMTPQEMAELTSSELLQVMFTLRKDATKMGCKWAEIKAEHAKLKKLLPHCLSVLTRGYLNDNPDWSVSYAKTFSTADVAYRKAVEVMVEAEKEARLLEVEYKATMKSLDALTSIGYVRNSELKLAR